MSLSRTWRRRGGDFSGKARDGPKDHGFCFICGSGFTREGLVSHFEAFHPNERQPGDDYDERYGKGGKGVGGDCEVP